MAEVELRPPGWPMPHPADEAWEHEGVLCAICRSPIERGWNGYIRLADGDRFPDVGPAGVEPHGNGWVGFDTAHGWDSWGDENDDFMAGIVELRRAVGGHVVEWDLPTLRAMVNVMAHAVAVRRG